MQSAVCVDVSYLMTASLLARSALLLNGGGRPSRRIASALCSDPRLQTALPLAPLTRPSPANRICSATGQSQGASLHRSLRERGVLHGRRDGCTRPRRRAGQERGCQGPRRYGSFRFRRDPAATGRVAADKTLPFEVRVPNAETRAAMTELEEGAGASFDSVADLMSDLNAEN